MRDKFIMARKKLQGADIVIASRFVESTFYCNVWMDRY